MMNCRSVVVVVLCLSVAACTRARPVVLPSGETGQIIRCHGAFQSIADCQEKAGEVCPKGYDVIDSSESSSPFVVANQSGLVGGSATKRSIMVRCH